MSEMIFYFKADGDVLKLLDIKKSAYTGNVNSYICNFELNDDWKNLTPIAVFTFENTSYTIALDKNNSCNLPHEIMQHGGTVQTGLFGTSISSENYKRISTNIQTITIEQGAYCESSTEPTLPTPDIWESLINKNVPQIGENGNWYIWDVNTQNYVDSKKPSQGEKGDQGMKGEKGEKGDAGFTPQKGIDYFTQDDINSLNIPTVDNELFENSYNAVSGNAVSKALTQSENQFYKKNESDSRYLLKHKVSSNSSQISGVSDYIPELEIFNYQIWGRSIQQSQPSKDNPQEIFCVGDLVTDTSDENYGKYRISTSLSGINYDIYLNQPLRGIISYGYYSDTKTERYNYALDYIDFNNQKIIRNVNEYIIDPIPQPTSILYNQYDASWLRTAIFLPNHSSLHQAGTNQTGDALSNSLQRLKRVDGVFHMTDDYIYTANESKYIYLYWKLDNLGLTPEESTTDDYVVRTAGNEPSYYKLKKQDGSYISSLSEVQSLIKEYYKDSAIKIYYTLEEPISEEVSLPKITTPLSEDMDFSVNTTLSPYEISLEYYADISTILNSINKQIDNLTNSILSSGGNV